MRPLAHSGAGPWRCLSKSPSRPCQAPSSFTSFCHLPAILGHKFALPKHARSEAMLKELIVKHLFRDPKHLQKRRSDGIAVFALASASIGLHCALDEFSELLRLGREVASCIHCCPGLARVSGGIALPTCCVVGIMRRRGGGAIISYIDRCLGLERVSRGGFVYVCFCLSWWRECGWGGRG